LENLLKGSKIVCIYNDLWNIDKIRGSSSLQNALPFQGYKGKVEIN